MELRLMAIRKVRKTVTGTRTVDGAGVSLVRVLGKPDVYDFDPFLMLDAFDSVNPEDYIKGFPWHPHRGIETVTYLIKGDIEHGDSLGNRGSIRDGDCQWMTAGSGIIHQEMPKASPRMLGAQLWVNLPAKDKMCPPKYRDITEAMIPAVSEGDATIRVISGSYKGTPGAMEGDYVRPNYLDVLLGRGCEWKTATSAGNTAFAYIIEGSAEFGPEESESIGAKHAVLLGDGDEVRVKAGPNGARMLFLEAAPLKEPIAWGGPIVMNTKDELRQAFKDLDEGKFIR